MCNDGLPTDISELCTNQTEHPLKNPFVLTFISVILGVCIGTIVAAFGVRHINFFLFSALFVGMIYSAAFNKPIPRHTRYKSALCYLLFMFVLISSIYFLKPSVLEGLQYRPDLIFAVILPVETIIYSILLYAGSKLLLKFQDNAVTTS